MDPFANLINGDPSWADPFNPAAIGDVTTVGQVPAAGTNPFSFDATKLLAGLKGVQAPPAPTPQAPPRAPDVPKPHAIGAPQSLQLLYSMLAAPPALGGRR